MYVFTADDRCDGCGARAMHKATKPGQTELLFCGHCHAANHTKMLEEYWLIESNVSPVAPVPVAAYAE